MAAHASQTELAQKLEKARRLVEIGGRYRHYKDSSRTYVIKDLCILESTEEVAVVYEAQYGEHISFIRPLGNWSESVQVEGKSLPRFEKI